mmetsp:Transcript_157552/g.482853  ORF Transcript_157552/g.482853 Transcript_157552/m.482853 type:complete len:153 (-) Transcript_157552:70-528(-)
MATSRRLNKELQAILASNLELVKEVTVDESNLLHWTALLQPEKPPYNKGAFRVSLQFPPEYPFKAPKVVFQTAMYHPNIDENGVVCLDILKQDVWKPTTTAQQILLSLVVLIDEPNANDPVNADVGQQFTTDKAKFMKSCAEHVEKHADKRV